jgi:RNA polymerase sigma-70 factor, ECF subfamily
MKDGDENRPEHGRAAPLGDEAVYQELREMAQRLLAREAPGLTLQPTALVHEVFLRMHRGAKPDFANDRLFFATAARSMRHILVEAARRRRAAKRGGKRARIDLALDEVVAIEPSENVLEIDAALEALAAEEPRAAELVHLWFFGGLTLKAAATVVGVSERTAQNDWAYARAWLLAKLHDDALRPDSANDA